MEKIGSVDIVLATRDRAGRLERTIRSIQAAMAECTIPSRLIVVDNGSSDTTDRVIAAFADKINVLGICEPQPGKNVALNAALGQVTADLIVFTDDDVDVDRFWLAAHERGANRWQVADVMAGRIDPLFPEQTPDWIRSPRFRLRSYAFAAFAPEVGEGIADVMPFGPNYSVRKSALVGLWFDETVGPRGRSYRMGSETEFVSRLKGRGHSFAYLPDALVHHRIEPYQIEIDHLLQRAFNAGRGYQVLRLDMQQRRRNDFSRAQHKARMKIAFYAGMTLLFWCLGEQKRFRWQYKKRFWQGRLLECQSIEK